MTKRTQNRIIAQLVTFSLLLSILAVASPCLAQNKEAALEKYKEGMAAIQSENYPVALKAFEESYRLNPKAGMLYNIAMCKKALFQYSNAIEAFELYLKEAGSGVNPAMKKDSEDAIRELNKMVGKLIVKDAPAGSQVILRGESVGKTPFAKPILLDPGQYPVRIVKEGYKPMETTVTIAAEAESVVNASLQSAPMTPPAPDDSDEAQEGDDPPPISKPVEPELMEEDNNKNKPSGLFWAGLGGTIVSGTLAGVFFGLQSSAANDYNTANSNLGDWYALYGEPEYDPDTVDTLLGELTEYGDNAEKYNKVAIAMTITASALAVGSIIVLIADLSGGEEESDSNVSAFLSPTGVTLTGRF